MSKDLTFALRSLRRSPGFTLVAVLTLALGIGANTSAFSVVNEIFLRPMPYPEAERLDRIYRATPQNSRGGISPADYLDLKDEMARYGEVSAYTISEMSLAAPGEAAQVASGMRIDAKFFPVLRVEPALGRGFRPEEEILGNHRVLILSHGFWQKRFGGDPGIIGRSVRVDGEPHEIVGVLPKDLIDWRHLGSYEVYRPLGLTAKEKADRTSTWMRLMGRRAAGLGRAEAEAFVAGIGQRLAADHPEIHAASGWRTLPLSVAVAPDNGPGIMSMLIGLSLFVLLIACSNLANLLLARMVARAREIAVRAALGASRVRLLRPLFLESLLLALIGGVLAIYVALAANDWLRGDGASEGWVFAIDWRVLAWAFGACLFTAVAFGVGPALFALRLDLNRTLKAGARGATGDRGHQRFRQLLVVGQFALAMVLVAGAALFARGVHDLNTRQYGWESDRLVTGTVRLPGATYTDDAQIVEFQRAALERLAALPGVESASLSYSMPFFGVPETRKYLVAGQPVPEPGREPVAAVNGISPRYFETVGIRLLEGRAIDARDTASSPRVFVINQAMARALFPGHSAVGQRLARAGEAKVEWGEVVGVVSDVQSIYPDRAPILYQLYQPAAQEPRQYGEIAVRTAGAAPSALVGSVREAMTALDPDVAVRQLQPAKATIAEAQEGWVVLGQMLSLLATLGLALASLGIYGVVARTMAQRRGEFGIRLALGAEVRDLVRLVLKSGTALAVVGAVLGLAGAAAVTQLLASLFPGMSTDGAPVLAGVTVLLMGVALLACYLPARSAARIDPTETLRAE
jgi:predicted permease